MLIMIYNFQTYLQKSLENSLNPLERTSDAISLNDLLLMLKVCSLKLFDKCDKFLCENLQKKNKGLVNFGSRSS